MVECLNQGRMLRRIFFADFQMALSACNEANIDSRLALQVTSKIRPLSQMALRVSFDAQAPSKMAYFMQTVSNEPPSIIFL